MRLGLDGLIYLAGTMSGSLVAWDDHEIPSAGGADVFALVLDQDGGYQWARAFGDEGEQLFGAMAVRAGSVLLAGSFTDSIPLGRGDPLAAGQGGSDLFLLELAP